VSSATGSPGYLQAAWIEQGSPGSVDGYRYAIGTTPGGSDIWYWTPTTAESLTESNLGLTADKTYWFSVQARSPGGLWSDVVTKAFVAGQTSVQLIYLPILRR
jgi:hypothetical protein